MEFFEVTAKCGHVGRGQYYEGRFFVRADSGRMAAALVRQKPRVKRDHKDAIQSVVKIDYAEFKAGQATYCANPYFSCCSIQIRRKINEGEWGEAIGDMHIRLEWHLAKILKATSGEKSLDLIDRAKKEKIITIDAADALHELRKFRNKLTAPDAGTTCIRQDENQRVG